MAALTFTDLQNEVYAQTGLDSNDTTNQTNVKRWINFVQQDFCTRWPWPFLYGRESVATIADYTTGTVTVSSGSTSVTGSGTTFTTTHGDGTYFIQFQGANDWYRVSARSSNTAITLEKAYQPTSNLTAGTFILRKFFYSMASTTEEVIDCRNWNTPIKLVQVDLRFIDDLRPNPQSTNSSYGYLMFGMDSSNNLIFTPYPFPSDARLFEFRVKKRPTDMSAGTDAPSIPNSYAHVLTFGANAVGFAFLRKMDLANIWNAKYEQRIADAKREYRPSEDYTPIFRSIDSVQRSKWIQYPSNYPVIVSG